MKTLRMMAIAIVMMVTIACGSSTDPDQNVEITLDGLRDATYSVAVSDGPAPEIFDAAFPPRTTWTFRWPDSTGFAYRANGKTIDGRDTSWSGGYTFDTLRNEFGRSVYTQDLERRSVVFLRFTPMSRTFTAQATAFWDDDSAAVFTRAVTFTRVD